MSDASDAGACPVAQAPAKPAAIHPAIIQIMRAIGPIAKSLRNEQQNFNYRGIDQVYNTVHPHFAEHGVYSTSTILAAEHKEGKSDRGKPYIHSILQMRFTFWAADGSSVSTEVVGEGIDYSGDKASNKAMSTADKYAILQLLKIPTAMVDADAPLRENPEPNRRAPKAQPRGERVHPDDIKALVGRWKDWWQAKFDEPPGREKWAEWVQAVTARKFDVLVSENWTPALVEACHAPMDEEGFPK